MANEVQGNYSLSFARRCVNENSAEGRKLLILRVSVGSTGFINGHWREQGDCYIRMMNVCHYALSLNPNNRLRGLLWHQGESDAVEKVSFEMHYNNLSRLVNSVRKEFSAPELPFVAGDFVHQWKDENMEICRPVVRAIRAFCENDMYSGFVETDGLKSNFQELGRETQCGREVIKDTIHFSRRSLYVLGERYYDAWKKIIRNCENRYV